MILLEEGRSTFTSHEVLCAAGITYRQLDTWVRAGRIHTVCEHHGPGFPREFEPGEAEVAIRMGALVRAGLLPDAAEDAARQLAAYGFAHLGGFRIEAA